jgi:hypothetical protein
VIVCARFVQPEQRRKPVYDASAVTTSP